MHPSRRTFLSNAGLAAMGAVGTALPGMSSTVHAAAGQKTDALNLRTDGTYDTVPLAKPAWTLGVVQSRAISINAENWRPERQRNLEHMLRLIDNSVYMGYKPDLLFFHEFPLTGWRRWTRAETLQLAIEIPGEQTDAIAKKAREHGLWIVFGAYVRDQDWPGHVLSITTLINPQGQIVDKHWKARNVKGVFPGWELFTTTIYDVLDQYVEMYGRDAVVPVTRTPLGNLCTSSTQGEPELFRAMAMKGGEVFLRTASGGFSALDMAAGSMYNRVYTAVVNQAISREENGPHFEDSNAGGSACYGPDGKAVAEANGKHEQLVLARIPIAELRARGRQPVVHMELYRDIFERYQSRYAPNLWSHYLPDSLEDAARYVSEQSRWK